MGIDFLNDLSVSQATIPAAVSRLAGFFILAQGVLLFLQKKNDIHKDIWADMSDVLLGGLIVFLFPEVIKFFELLVNSLAHVDAKHSSAILEYIKDSNISNGESEQNSSTAGWTQLVASFLLKSTGAAGGSSATFLIAEGILRPLADLVNTLCFPTFMIIRAASLKIVYWIAPLVLVIGAMSPFRALWKQWFMIYVALLVSGPALIMANDFCEECFNLYVRATDSPLLGFFMIALARFKVFQAVIDLCYRIFKV